MRRPTIIAINTVMTGEEDEQETKNRREQIERRRKLSRNYAQCIVCVCESVAGRTLEHEMSNEVRGRQICRIRRDDKGTHVFKGHILPTDCVRAQTMGNGHRANILPRAPRNKSMRTGLFCQSPANLTRNHFFFFFSSRSFRFDTE